MQPDQIKWTLHAVNKIQDAGIGDPGRLDAIKDTIEQGREVYQSDTRYLQAKLKQLGDIAPKITKYDQIESSRLLIIIDRLLESEIGSSDRLLDIRYNLTKDSALFAGDSDYLDEKYDQLQKTDGIDDTRDMLSVIEKLIHAEIGNRKRLDSIKNLLDRQRIPPPEDIVYINKRFKQYQKINVTSAPQVKAPEVLRYRNPNMVLVLSLLGFCGACGIGHLYAGRVRRGVILLACLLALLVSAIATFGMVIWVSMLVIYYVMSVWQIFDARSICRYNNAHLGESQE